MLRYCENQKSHIKARKKAVFTQMKFQPVFAWLALVKGSNGKKEMLFWILGYLLSEFVIGVLR